MSGSSSKPSCPCPEAALPTFGARWVDPEALVPPAPGAGAWLESSDAPAVESTAVDGLLTGSLAGLAFFAPILGGSTGVESTGCWFHQLLDVASSVELVAVAITPFGAGALEQPATASISTSEARLRAGPVVFFISISFWRTVVRFVDVMVRFLHELGMRNAGR
jgi:hypothetical protein